MGEQTKVHDRCGTCHCAPPRKHAKSHRARHLQATSSTNPLRYPNEGLRNTGGSERGWISSKTTISADLPVVCDLLGVPTHQSGSAESVEIVRSAPQRSSASRSNGGSARTRTRIAWTPSELPERQSATRLSPIVQTGLQGIVCVLATSNIRGCQRPNKARRRFRPHRGPANQRAVEVPPDRAACHACRLRQEERLSLRGRA